MVPGTRRRLPLVAVAVLLAAVVAVDAVRAIADDELTLPRHRLGPGGSELRGSPDAPVLVEVYGDFACPGCARFHRQAGPALDKLVGEGRVRVAFHHLAVLGPASVRAASAAICAGDAGAFWPYHDRLFAWRRLDPSTLADSGRLVALGGDVGAGGERFERCVRQGTYEAWVRQVTEAALAGGVTAPPTVLVDGRRLGKATLPALRAAVISALAQHPPGPPS